MCIRVYVCPYLQVVERAIQQKEGWASSIHVNQATGNKTEYHYDLVRMQQTNIQTAFQRAIRR